MALKKKKTTGKSAVKKTVKKKTASKKVPPKQRPPKKTVKRKTTIRKSEKAVPAGKKIKHPPLCIVGIGASAGGLEALEGLFTKMPVKSNMAFVIIQHLAPQHKSIMGSLLQKYTGIKILQIQDGIKVEANCMYLNPPDKDVSILSGSLYLNDPQDTHATRLPIDFFFRSLAQDQREKAICIILSGTGTDGTLGLKSVKGEGGMTMVQQESQAKYDSMPRNAINTGLVDFILPVETMPRELSKYTRHPYIDGPRKTMSPKQEHLNTFNKIFLLIRSVTGHDFSHYKQNTIRRRIERRMAVHQLNQITDYLKYLQGNTAEVEALYKDMLITVTNFFRDPEAFEMLSEKVIATIAGRKLTDSFVRVWVPGCATGEEAYSMAILLLESMGSMEKHFNIQIFATDIDTDAVEFARAGIYPESISADVSAGRLKRFFTKVESTYSISKQVREMVVFAAQNLIKDPPFSKLDLVSCRNVLIYMDSVLQKQILPLFHYVLNSDGFLFLGTSESIGEFADFFSPVSTKWKIFRRKGVILEKAEHPILPFYETIAGEKRPDEIKTLTETNIRQMAENLILQDYAPPCVILNGKLDIIYFHGKTDAYLTSPAGEPTFNVLKMARKELRYTLSALIHKAAHIKKKAISKGLTIKVGSVLKTIDLIVRPLPEKANMPIMSMIIFDDRAPLDKREGGKKPARVKTDEPRVVALEQELQSTKEYLQTTIEELETSNEELKSTNEELQSTNEELQSTNEEMETSKEELQSTNEELETVNSELQSKVEELSRANNDLNNLLSSTEIGTIFLDTKLRISRFTPSSTKIFNLIQTDIGRPITDITSLTSYEKLNVDAKKVLQTLVSKELEIRSNAGRWFNMRIMPYRTVENVIDGVVLTYSDITDLKTARQTAENSYDEMEKKINERTSALIKSVAKLKVEVKERKKAEKALKENRE